MSHRGFPPEYQSFLEWWNYEELVSDRISNHYSEEFFTKILSYLTSCENLKLSVVIPIAYWLGARYAALSSFGYILKSPYLLFNEITSFNRPSLSQFIVTLQLSGNISSNLCKFDECSQIYSEAGEVSLKNILLHNIFSPSWIWRQI